MNVRLVALAFSITCLAAMPAMAAESYPSDIRTITATDASSPCIGVPKTPVCAAETVLACFARADAALCDRVTERRHGTLAPPQDRSYRVAWILITRTKPPAAPALYADVAIDTNDDRYYYALEHRGEGWFVDDRAIDGEWGTPITLDPDRLEIVGTEGAVPIRVARHE